jgi:predicted transcriptional regulator of viral defense system
VATDRTLLRRLVPIAEEHGGLISVLAAERAGVSNRMLLHYAAVGDLERAYRGIYRLVWLPRHRFADVIAACLRVGDDAVAMGETAAAVWELAEAMPSQVTICTTRPWRGTLAGGRVVVCSLADDERTVRDSVPVTSLGRTLADLAAADPSRAVDAVDDAQHAGILARREWPRLRGRYPSLAALDLPGVTEHD